MDSTCLVPTVKHGRGGVMVWGALLVKIVGDLFKIEGILNLLSDFRRGQTCFPLAPPVSALPQGFFCPVCPRGAFFTLLKPLLFCTLKMDLISWSLNSIDKVFSTLRNGKADPSCPDGTHAAGYTFDPWGKWRLVCLAQLSVEDVEDVYLFGFLIIGFLVIGIGGFLNYQAVWEQKMERGNQSKLLGKIFRGGETQNEKLSQADQKLCACLAHLSRLLETPELVRKMDATLEQVSARI